MPQKFHGRIIGAKGRAINKLKDDFGILSIDFPKNPSLPNQNTVRLTGPEESVERCRDYLLDQVAEWEEIVPPETHKRSYSHQPAAPRQSPGFSVQDAPWKDRSESEFYSQDDSEFPSLEAIHPQTKSDNWAAKVKH